MKRVLGLMVLCLCILAGWAQNEHAIGVGGSNLPAATADTLPAKLDGVTLHKQQHFRAVPAGNYSGIANMGGGNYAIISDKGSSAGYHLLHITFTADGDIDNVDYRGFHNYGGSKKDMEAIAYNPTNKHLYIGCEADASVIEADSTGITGSGTIEDYKLHEQGNLGIESLCYEERSAHLFTVNEGPLRGDSAGMLRLKELDGSLKEVASYSYKLENPIMQHPEQGSIHVFGCSELANMGDGTLLSLEREFYVPRRKLGAWVRNQIFRFIPGTARKQLVVSWQTRLTLFDRSLANYEGMCLGPKTADGRRVLVLCADSQDQYKGVLKDWFRTIVLPH